MSVLTQSGSHTGSIDIDNNTTTTKNNNVEKNRQRNVSGKHKKDYVYKFWMVLCQRCEPMIKAYNNLQLMQNQRNNNAESDKADQNDISKDDNDNDTSMKSTAPAAADTITQNEDNINHNEKNSNELTFEKLGEFMGNKQLITLVGKFWAVLQSYVQNEPIKKESTKDARIILTTLMISMFPNDVLDVSDIKDLDALSEECYNSAQNVLKTIFDHKGQFTDQNGGENQTKFHCQAAYKAINDFFDAFKNWQLNDKTKILESVLNFYEQWKRSHQVLKSASMNEAQKEGVLKTIDANINSMKKKILQLVDGKEDEMNKLCSVIDQKLQTEQDNAKTKNTKPNQSNDSTASDVTMASAANNNTQNNNNNNSNVSNSQNAPPTVEEQLRARGVPVNIKTGRNLLKNNGNDGNNDINMSEKTNGQNNNNKNGDAKYLTEVDGQTVLNLDEIIMQEASKNYWHEFEKEIVNENWSRLFELLSEVLQRVKKLSPQKDHAMLDDMIDVSFIQQTIQNGLIDASGFYGIFYGIWKQLRSLHAPAADSAWDEWHDQILKDMSKSDATWAKLLSSVFNTFLLKIDEIEDQIKAIEAIKQSKK